MFVRGARAVLRGSKPSARAGIASVVVLVGAITALLFPLKQVAPVASLGVVYLLGVGLVSTIWGAWLGFGMSILSAAAFNFFHLPPVGRFTIVASGNWVALGAFLVTAMATSSLSQLTRRRTVEAIQRRAEADLMADIAQILLARAEVRETLGLVARRIAITFDLSSVSLVEEAAAGDGRHEAIALGTSSERLGTLIIPRDLPPGLRERLSTRVIPALTAVLRAAQERERLIAEAVQTEGLRRSEAVKTAVLRAVSHDLRSPVTAMIAAGAAIRGGRLSPGDYRELGGLVEQEGTRLARLIDDLLALSRLQSDAAAPQLAECSVDEVIDSALAAQAPDARVDVDVDVELSPVHVDFVQLERALANIMENAVRYSGGQPVVVRARQHDDRVTIRIIDHGPGIAQADQERVFAPFYRADDHGDGGHAGSGLGLAIARGFVEASGGRIWIESSPGRGSVFVIELRISSPP